MEKIFVMLGFVATSWVPHALFAAEGADGDMPVGATVLDIRDGDAQMVFDDETGMYFLRVPLVDTLNAAGQYQEVLFKTARPDDVSTWQLLSVEQANPLALDEVRVVVTDEVPAQAFLRVKGAVGGCGGLDGIGKIAIKTRANDFSVFVYHPAVAVDPSTAPSFGCLAVTWPFIKSIPLPVYGLDAGTYTYSVNGEHNGEFTLFEDNRFADDGFIPLQVMYLQPEQ
jgi:hypothetical protein